MGVSLTRPAWHGPCRQHDHPCPGDFTSLSSIAVQPTDYSACKDSGPAMSCDPSCFDTSGGFPERLCKDAGQTVLLQGKVSPGTGGMAV